jgi:hypothetical protein
MLREPRLHLGNLALLLVDDRLSELARPRVLGMRQGNPRHIDTTRVVRDHLAAEIDVRITALGHVHALHLLA